MQPTLLSKFCFGLGLTTAAAKGLLIWSANRLYDLTSPSPGNSPAEVIDPANILVSVMAIIGLAAAVVAFRKGERGHLLYASTAFNSIALLVNPTAYAIY
ncbi:MAG: hypothetical protein QGG67_18485 [Gammaproteobacteria bacterium]|jgi:hypothetical protein|nr:hypothetical protein [Chromatiales bacterium]MDP6097951.1 hypothetical protein [Gammaproteobacteria bacterium]